MIQRVKDYYRVKVTLKIAANSHADALAKIEARLSVGTTLDVAIVEATAAVWKEPK